MSSSTQSTLSPTTAYKTPMKGQYREETPQKTQRSRTNLNSFYLINYFDLSFCGMGLGDMMVFYIVCVEVVVVE